MTSKKELQIVKNFINDVLNGVIKTDDLHHGWCGSIHTMTGSGWLYNNKLLFRDWKHFSGCTMFPVSTDYKVTTNWVGKSLELRLDLGKHLIKHINEGLGWKHRVLNRISVKVNNAKKTYRNIKSIISGWC